MASVKFGGLVQDARGVVGDVVYSRNRAGAFIRARYAFEQPSSEWAVQARAAMGQVGNNWKWCVPEGARAAWRAFAATHKYRNVFGDQITLDGPGIYCALNLRLVLVNRGQLTYPPAEYFVPDLGRVTVDFSVFEGEWRLSALVGRALTDDEGLYVAVTKGLLVMQPVYRSCLRNLNITQLRLFGNGEALRYQMELRFPAENWPGVWRVGVSVSVLNWVTGAMSVPIVQAVDRTYA